MKKTIYITFLITLIGTLNTIHLLSQTTKTSKEPLDTIFKLNNQKVAAKVANITTNYVSFTIPGHDKIYTIERKEVHKIVYKNGKVEILNNPAVVVLDENSWEAVWITEDKRDVANLFKIAEIEVSSPQNARSFKAAENGAIIRLKKKAASMKGSVVLITHKERTGGYGEYPGYLIRGIVYGLEPPENE